jgi:hypothetical protein
MFDGKHSIVTGGSAGIGIETARAVAVAARRCFQLADTQGQKTTDIRSRSCGPSLRQWSSFAVSEFNYGALRRAVRVFLAAVRASACASAPAKVSCTQAA